MSKSVKGLLDGNQNGYKHGLCYSRIYCIYQGMIQRCYNEKKKMYKHYGGRGITVCDRWLSSFENFYEDMHGTYRDDLSLDRYPDNNGNYGPGNCRWATPKQQINNSRSIRPVTYNGETKSLTEWAETTGIARHLIKDRINRGCPLNEVFQPKVGNKRRWMKYRESINKDEYQQ